MRNLLTCFLSLIFLGSCGKPPQAKVVHGEKILIINADDLGMNDETNKAIIESYRAGIVTSTSAFVTFIDPIPTLQRVHNEYPNLPIGLHLNLSEGKPVLPASEIPSLVDKDGNFYSPDKIISKLADMKIEEVRKELNAQVKLFLSSGVPIDHINCHHHMAALFTPFHIVMREISLQYKVPMRNPVPYSIYQKMNVNSGGGSSFAGKKMITYGILHPFKSIPMMKKVGPTAFIEQEKIDKEAGVGMPDWFIDAFFENATVSDLNSIIHQLPEGISELMCHPGRLGEGKVLSNTDVRKNLEACHVKLGQFDSVRK
ncbi:MAG: ChbG/HpnK family deacetylase [Bacteroidia bacterium]|nr:ChbG/HpnK family deacetylase [Bacteroidia bacterium]